MKSLFIMIILAFTFIVKASAQNYEPPKSYHFADKHDFEKAEADVIKTADWLQQASWATQAAKIDAADQFILDWAQGSPKVLIELRQAIMDISDANPQLGFVYMAQFSKYTLQHKGDFDKTKANVAALRAVVAKYNMEPTHKRDNDVEKLMELDKNSQLESWIINEFNF